MCIKQPVFKEENILKVDDISFKQCVYVEGVDIDFFKVIITATRFNHSFGLTLQYLLTK